MRQQEHTNVTHTGEHTGAGSHGRKGSHLLLHSHLPVGAQLQTVKGTLTCAHTHLTEAHMWLYTTASMKGTPTPTHAHSQATQKSEQCTRSRTLDTH